MHNIKVIRENPGAFDNAMIRRGLGPMSNQILEMDKQVREEKTVLQELQQQANDWAKQIGLLKAKAQIDPAVFGPIAGKVCKIIGSLGSWPPCSAMTI